MPLFSNCHHDEMMDRVALNLANFHRKCTAQLAANSMAINRTTIERYCHTVSAVLHLVSKRLMLQHDRYVLLGCCCGAALCKVDAVAKALEFCPGHVAIKLAINAVGCIA